MKILLDSQGISLSSFGVYRYTSDLLLGLNDLGYDVKISAALYPRRAWGHIPKQLFSRSTLRYPNWQDSIAKRINSWADVHSERNVVADVVHTTYYSAWIPTRKFKHVMTVYDFIHERFPAFFNENDRASKFKRLQMARADAIICISDATLKDLKHFYPEFAGKAEAIPLGLTQNVVPIAAGDNVSQRQASTLLFVGSRSGYKNFDMFLGAVAKVRTSFPDIRIEAIGGGPLSAKEKARIRELGFTSTSFQHLTTTDEFLVAKYLSATALVFPSLYEGFGYPPLEAMSLGCPVIVGQSSSMPEVAGDAGNYFDPTDVSSLSSAIIRVLEDPESRASKAELGRQRSQEFSTIENARKTAKVYETVYAPQD